MNNELPKVDITYGTKRYNERTYKTFYTGLVPAIKGEYSVRVTDIDGNTFETNVLKTNNRSGVIVFSNRRMLLCQIATLELIPRQEIETITSNTEFFEKSSLPKPKTFHLILNKAHAMNRNVAVIIKDGKTYKGKCDRCDYDTVILMTNSGSTINIMYDIVKRIVPIEADGSLAE
ncbi:hypothetical protein [Xenorhabdus szentirmaii]|uniref:Uncharacterized protein n=1 Tax=Xenorhabdus szentirmaii DSM 16338 TaxID=1427518 RepID=W1IRE6_9GAMM|nr:hypothetical protein [Xenorhabdus szentirmaii]PHM30541.1 hypothetical protein Xsze_04131 [Xenorhabdus szentirmaii DSM 16338]CDL80999.1 hypothetical protein XSR1_100049 [Xenorhabdus szentirmaii DSM 16338]